jgi:hypothetical protein
LAGCISVFCFWGYHFYLTLINKTTNESFKWGDVDDEIQNITEMMEKKIKVKYVDGTDKHIIERRKNLEMMVKNDAYPSNIYSKGIFQNIKEMLFPLSLQYMKRKFKFFN